MTMKRCSKILAWLLTFIMVLNLMPVAVFAADDIEQGPEMEAATDDLGISGKSGALVIYDKNKYTALTTTAHTTSGFLVAKVVSLTDGKILDRGDKVPSVWTIIFNDGFYNLRSNGQYLDLSNGAKMSANPYPVKIVKIDGKYRLLEKDGKTSVNLKSHDPNKGFQASNWTTTAGNAIEPNELFEIIPVEINDNVTVQFNTNGAPETKDSIEKNVGDVITLPDYEGDYTGRELIGWKNNVDGIVYSVNGKYTLPDKVSITFTAQWAGRKKVIFDVNGGDEAAPASITIKSGVSTVTMPDYTGHKEGYKFLGWAETKNEYVTVVQSGKSMPKEIFRTGSEYKVQPEKDNRLYAVWSYLGPVNVEFGIRKDASIPKEPGNFATSDYTSHVKTVQPIYEQRWVIDTKASGTIEGNHLVNDVTRSLTQLPTDEELKGIYPTYDPETQYVQWYVIKWQNNGFVHVDGVILDRNLSTVTYDNNTHEIADVPLGYQVETGTTIIVGAKKGTTTATDPVRTGYNFVGWNTQADGQGTTYKTGDIVTISSNTTFYAMWSKGTLKVTVQNRNNNGEVLTGASFELQKDAKKITILNSNGYYDQLENDTVYSLEETIAPTGHLQNSEKFWFKVVPDTDGGLVMQVCDVNGNPVEKPEWLTISAATVTNGITQITITVKDKPDKFDVIFVDYNGETIKAPQKYDYGTPVESIVQPSVDPVREADDQFTYTFAGWDPQVSTVTGNTVYTATYSTTTNKYKVSFVDENEKVLKEETEYNYGTAAEDIAKPADPSKAADAQYTYEFSGWDPEIADVTGNVTYIATYRGTVKKYTVTFVDEDGTVLKTAAEYDYGTAADDIVKPADPEKDGTAQHSYTFTGWQPAVAEVKDNAVYTATYSSTVNKYAIEFVNYDDTLLQRVEVEYGATPTYTGETPKKASTDQYSYTFAGWDSELMAVTGTATYKAKYTETVNQYSYTIHHYLLGTQTQVKEDQTGTVDYDTVINAEIAEKYESLDLRLADSEATQTVTVKNGENVLVIYYTLPLTISAVAASKTYGEADPSELSTIVTGKLADDTVTYNVGRETGVTAGTYRISVTDVVAPEYYEVLTNKADFTISPKAITLTVDAKSKTYGEADPAFTASFGEGDLVGDDEIEYTLTRESGENAGTYEISTTIDNGNYDVTVKPAKLTITKKAITLTVDAKSKTYGETDPAFTASFGESDLVGTDKIEYTLSRTEGEDAGTYAISTSIEHQNYDVTVVPANLTIGKKDVTLTVDAKSKTYGEADPAFTASFGTNDLVGEDTIAYTLSRATGENVGTYAISTTIENNNYNVTVVPANLTIGQKAVTLTVANKSKVYGEADPELTAEAAGLVGEDTLSYTLSRVPGEDVGQYAITAEPGENPNYAVTVTAGTFTISASDALVLNAAGYEGIYDRESHAVNASTNVSEGTKIEYSLDGTTWTETAPSITNVGEQAVQIRATNSNYNTKTQTVSLKVSPKTVTIQADSKTKVYDNGAAADPELTATVTGEIAEEPVSYTLARTAGQNVGEYAITVTLGDNPNYDVTASGATFTVTASDALVLTAEGYTGIYNKEAHAVTASVNVEDDTTVEYSTDGENWTTEAPAITNAGEQTVQVRATNSNYITKSDEVTLKIQPVTATVTAKATGKTYGGADPALDATVTGVLDGEELSYTLSREEGEDAGEYGIIVTKGNNPNYDVTATNGIFTIAPSDAMVLTANGYTGAYDQSAHAVTAGVNIEEGTTIEYSVDGGDWTTEAPSITDAGKQTVNVRATNRNYVEKTAEVTLQVLPIPATVTANAKSKIFGSEEPALNATVTGVLEGESLNYTLSRATGEAAGEYPITVTLGENRNYTVTAADGTFTVTPKSLTIKADNKTKVYDNNAATDPALTATVTGTIGNDEIKYTLSRIEGQNVGDYDITVTPGENPNYTVNVTGGTFAITPKAITIQADNTTKVYDNDASTDPELKATVTGAVNGDTINYTLSREPGQAVKEYAIAVTADKNPNYTVSVKGGIFSITPKAITIKADDQTKNYDNNAATDPKLTATVTGAVDGDEINYELTREAGQAVKAYAISVTESNNPNYNVTLEGGTFTITSKEVTVKADNKTKVYDNKAETDPELTATVTGTVEGEEINYTVSRAAGQNAGDYAITVTAGENPNYDVKVEGGTFAITKKPVTIKADGKTKVYDNVMTTDPELTATVTGAIDGDIVNYALSREAGQDAADYVISVTAGVNPNYEVTTESGTFSITKKPITVKADDKTKVYDNDTATDAALTAKVNGAVAGDTINYTLSREAGQNVGRYAITVTEGENKNYTLSTEGGTFEITPKAISVKADGKTKEYDNNASTDPELTATVSGAVAGDTVNYTLSREAGQDVKEYVITVAAGENPNYKVTVEGGTFSITKKAITVKADDQTKIYDNDEATDPALTATVTGAVAGDTVNYTVSRAAGQDVGSYTITAAAGENPNYKVTAEGGTFSITKKPITVKADDKTKVYDNNVTTDPALTAAVTDAVEGDEISYTLARAEGENVGDYAITVTAGENPNYDVTVEGGTFKVTPKAVTVTAVDKTKTYDNDATTDPGLTAVVTGNVEGEGINYILSRDAGQNVAEYTITVTPGTNPNYTVTAENGTFSITQRAVTVKADDQTKVYDKDPSTDPGLTATVNGAVSGENINYTLSRENGQNAGQYTISVTAGENPNYAVTVQGGTFSITPKAVTVKADGSTKVYDNDPTTDPALTATVTGAVEGDTLNYTLSREDGQNVEEYPITVTAGENPNYKVSVEGGTFSITPKAITVAADDKTKVYDNDETTDPELTATVTGAVEGDTVNYTLSRVEGQDVDDYAITTTAGQNPNYTVIVEGGTFRITPKAITVTADTQTKVYDNDETTDPELTATVTGAVEGDTVNYTLSRIAGQDVADYAITTTAGQNPNYTVTVQGGTFSISPKPLTIKAENKEKIYDNNPLTDPELTAEVTGTVEGDTVNYTLSRADGQNAAEYAIIVTPGTNPNYAVTVEGGKFLVKPRAITVTADNKTKTYDNDLSTDPELTATVDNAVAGDQINYELSREAGQDVDDYAIAVTAGENANYTVSVEGGTFSVLPREVTVKAENKTKEYNNDVTTDPELTAEVTGAVKGETINYGLSREEGQDADDYTITVTAGENPNYKVNVEGGIFTITPKPITITAADKTKVYDKEAATDPELTAEVTGAITGDTVNYNLSRDAGQDVKKYTITVTPGKNPNYAVTVENATFEITPKAITVKADDKTKVYDRNAEKDPKLTATVTDAVEGDEVNYTLSREVGQDVAEYPITVTAGSNPNYTVTVEKGTFEITPKAITVKADDKTKIYDKDAEKDPELTATVTGVVEGDEINYELSRKDGQNVDEYPITVTAGTNPNYTVTVEGGTFKITPKAITVKAVDKTKVYDKNAETDPELTATVTGAIEGDTVNYTLSRDAGQDAANYAITVTAGENPNYTVNVQGGQFSITKRPLTITADPKEKTWGVPDPEPLTYQVDGLVEGDELQIRMSRATGKDSEDSGEYPITVELVNGTDISKNYEIKINNSLLTIVLPEVSIDSSLDDSEKSEIYSGTPVVLTAQMAGLDEYLTRYALQWQVSTQENPEFTDIAGANGRTYTYILNKDTIGNEYRVVVSLNPQITPNE